MFFIITKTSAKWSLPCNTQVTSSLANTPRQDTWMVTVKHSSCGQLGTTQTRQCCTTTPTPHHSQQLEQLTMPRRIFNTSRISSQPLKESTSNRASMAFPMLSKLKRRGLALCFGYETVSRGTVICLFYPIKEQKHSHPSVWICGYLCISTWPNCTSSHSWQTPHMYCSAYNIIQSQLVSLHVLQVLHKWRSKSMMSLQ